MAASAPTQPRTRPSDNSSGTKVKTERGFLNKKGKARETTLARTAQRDVSGSSWDECKKSAWDWTSLTEPISSRMPPVFTKDGSYFFALAGSSVKIHSVSTGQVVSTLTAPRLQGNTSLDIITSAIVNPDNAFQLITGSSGGRLMIWDFIDATLLHTIDISQPIHYITAHKDLKESVFVAASKPSRGTNTSEVNAVVLRVSIKIPDLSVTPSTSRSLGITPVGKTRFPTGLAFSPNGAWLVATAGHKVYIARTSSLNSGFTKYVSPERLTCLAFHPFEEYFATGDEKGHVRLWYCLNENLATNARGVEKRTQTTSLHWHAHAVSSIAFLPNGAYLLSGGEEAVLVIWQLHTGRKEFVPRVGAPIGTISISTKSGIEEEYLLGLTDATFSFVNSGTLRVSRSYSRIKIEPSASTEWATSSQIIPPIAVHPLTSTVILPSSHPTSIQIYSPSTSTLISELEISPSNRVSRRDDKPLQPPRVEKVIVCSSGLWMATVDAREGEDGFSGEVYLKIWAWERKTSNWILNTRIDRPHGPHKVTNISFSPISHERQLQLVTTSKDGYAKIWRLCVLANRDEEFWISHSAFNFRNEVPLSASWSPDASILSVSFGSHIVIYDPAANVILHTLVSPEFQHIKSAEFIGRKGRFFVTITSRTLILWDLIMKSVRWHHNLPLDVEKLIPHPEDDTFAVFHSHRDRNTSVAIFHTTSSNPLTVHCLPFHLRNVVWYHTLQPLKKFSFIGVNDLWDVVVFGDLTMIPKEIGESSNRLQLEGSKRKTIFQDIFGSSAFDGSPNEVTVKSLSHTTGGETIFGGPAYLTPPLVTLFDPLVHAFLTPRPLLAAGGNEMECDDEDVEMDEDVEVETSTSRTLNSTLKKDVDSLVDLFRKHSVRVESEQTPRQTNDGGNGVLNGIVDTTKHKPVTKQIQKAPSIETAIPSTGNRKRKLV